MEYVRPLTSLATETNAGRLTTELNVVGIRSASDVPTYIKIQNTTQIYAYSYSFKDPPLVNLLNGDCTRNQTVIKYNSYGVNF